MERGVEVYSRRDEEEMMGREGMALETGNTALLYSCVYYWGL